MVDLVTPSGRLNENSRAPLFSQSPVVLGDLRAVAEATVCFDARSRNWVIAGCRMGDAWASTSGESGF